ncbi:hypothetical protein CIB48_g4680 [Xylaria polymorpha]|nr:hypothetical protein CIB48_g4680 [Xylaria polymorpha]
MPTFSRVQRGPIHPQRRLVAGSTIEPYILPASPRAVGSRSPRSPDSLSNHVRTVQIRNSQLRAIPAIQCPLQSRNAIPPEHSIHTKTAQLDRGRAHKPQNRRHYLPVGGFAAAAPATASAAAEEADEPAPAAQEKTLFTLKLTAFDASAKAKVIKEVKNLLGLSLVDSKKFVESAPKTMKESVPKEEAEKIVATMKELGATVVMD